MALQPTVGWSEVTTNQDTTPIADLAGYRVYRSVVAGVYAPTDYDEALVPCRTHLKITNGLTKYVPNYFKVVAFDTSNNESADSAEVSTMVTGGLILR